MFEDIISISTSRLIEVKGILDHIKDNAPDAPIPFPSSLTTMKGLFYIHIYGAFEYTVTATVQRTINLLNQTNVKIKDCKPILYSLILNSECDSLYNATSSKWNKRRDLFNKIEGNSEISISSDLFPTDGKNIRYAQLESIWTTFGIELPILNESSIGGRIKDIVDNRNAIAHGNSSASDIGSRVSLSDLYRRYDEISGYCSYIINVFENYMNDRKYVAQYVV